MAEITDDPPPVPTPHRWRPLLPHIDWRSKARWFAAEYLIVVLGVLSLWSSPRTWST